MRMTTFDRVRHGLRGALFSLMRQPARAVAAYRDSHRAAPDHVPTLLRLGWLEAQQQRWQAAAHWLQRAVALAPDAADAWFNLAYVQEQAGDDDAALAAFRRATALDPGNDRAWYGLGLLHARHGRHADAAAALTEAGRLQPMNGLAWYALGMAWQHCNAPDRVAAVIEHTLTHDPQAARRLIRDTGRSDYARRLD